MRTEDDIDRILLAEVFEAVEASEPGTTRRR
jgi:hypothetical protein